MSRGAKHIDQSTAENKKNSEMTSDAAEFSPFKQDIDDLINEFCKHQSTSLADLKMIWVSRKFSCIYEATPSPDFTMYMQTLYAQCLDHMVSSKSLSRRLGGLYCLYCLHKTQPFKPPYRIYISLRELKNLKYLVTIAKEEGVAVVSHLVKRMLEKNMFYFGSVDTNEASVAEIVNQLTELQNAQVIVQYSDGAPSPHGPEHRISMDVVKKCLYGYAEAKKEAITEASEVMDVQSIEHIVDDKGAAEVTLQQITDSWDGERNVFVQQTGFSKFGFNRQHPELHRDEEEDDDNDDFEQMLEDLLPDPQRTDLS